MNIKEYIESGVLEAYVLGALPEHEHAEVAANIAMYPELASEVASIEAAMQQFAEASAVQPPAFMQEKIWNAIEEQAPAKSNGSSKTIQFTPDYRRPAQWQRAAIWIILISSVLVNIWLMSQRNKQQEQTALLQQRLDTMQQSQNRLAQVIESYRSEKEMMADSMVETVVMKSMQPGHPMAATVYWDKSKNEAYVAMKKLPPPPQGMQYQMWVIQDGKPVSMGMLPNDMVENDTVTRLPMSVASSQAFAISLEKEGGNPTPTKVMVLGKTAS